MLLKRLAKRIGKEGLCLLAAAGLFITAILSAKWVIENYLFKTYTSISPALQIGVGFLALLAIGGVIGGLYLIWKAANVE